MGVESAMALTGKQPADCATSPLAASHHIGGVEPGLLQLQLWPVPSGPAVGMMASCVARTATIGRPYAFGPFTVSRRTKACTPGQRRLSSVISRRLQPAPSRHSTGMRQSSTIKASVQPGLVRHHRLFVHATIPDA